MDISYWKGVHHRSMQREGTLVYSIKRQQALSKRTRQFCIALLLLF